MFTLWPEELRADLRAGIKARNQGDPSLSERYLTRFVHLFLIHSYAFLAPSGNYLTRGFRRMQGIPDCTLAPAFGT